MRDMRQILFFTFLLLFIACGQRQNTSRSIEENEVDSDAVRKWEGTLTLPVSVKSRTITLQDGLPSNVVMAMTQDQKGFLWLCTQNGLARYDGNKVTLSPEKNTLGSWYDARVKKVIEDSAFKKMWVYSASERFQCMDMVDGSYEEYLDAGARQKHFTHSLLAKGGQIWLWGDTDGAMTIDYRKGTFMQQSFGIHNLGTNRIVQLDTISRDQVLVCTDKDVFLYDAGKLSCILKNVAVDGLCHSSGSVLLLSRNGKIYRMNGSKANLLTSLPYMEGERVTGSLPLPHGLLVFTNKGTFGVSLENGRVKRTSGEWNVPNGMVVKDNKGRDWVYNKTGIIRLVRDGSLLPLKLLPNKGASYVDKERFHIVEDTNGLIWISTYGNGLFVFSQDLKSGQHFVADEKGESPVVSNYLLDVIADRHQGVWISSEYGGVSHIEVLDKGVERIFPNPSRAMDFSNVIRMVKKLSDGRVCVSTRDGWLYQYSPDMRKMMAKWHFDSNVYAILQNEDSTMWIGTRGKGVYGVRGLDFRNHNIFCLERDLQRRVWMGTFGEGLSVAIPHNDSYRVRTFFADSVGLAEVRCLAMGKKGILWVGTSGGLVALRPNEFLKDSKKFQVYERGYEIHDMLIDRHGKLWLSVPAVGMVLVEYANEEKDISFKVYNTANGLINNMVQTIAEASNGDFWIGTQQGVSRLNHRESSFENYMFDRSLMGNVYNENSSVCLDDGRILLGGNFGLTIIDPKAVHHRHVQTDVVITNCPYSSELFLDYDKNSPRIEFSTLDFSDVSNVKYTYKLDGYDEDWSRPSPTTWASYRNLPPGNYVFRVKASGLDSRWGKETVLEVKVASPFYLSPYALILYILVLGGVLFFIVRNVREKKRLRQKVKLEQELTKYKLVFFTNIAHEFRTPLTLIQGSLEKERHIMKVNGWQKELEKTLGTMDKSVGRMLRLINQLLEFRKMQAGKLKLSLQETEIVMFVKNIYRSFLDAAESKEMGYSFKSNVSSEVMFLDQQKMDKVIYNLLSNAFKYTPTRGQVAVELEVTNDGLFIKVSDSGVGIPKEKRKQLFSRFMQSSYIGDSFGIGLHLSYEIVLLHHGNISYEESPFGGSMFVVQIPRNKDIYESSDFLVADSPILEKESVEEQENTLGEELPKASKPLNRYHILLVEDDNDVRNFLADELRVCFDVKAVSDGQTALSIVKKEQVDLIVSDVMMPEMNGFELTKRLKNRSETNHIPIILLTALSDDENVLEGTESGADAYMTKPFSPKLLVARIFQLLDQRERLKEKFSENLDNIRPTMCVSDQDQLFVKRFDAIVFSHLSDTSLSVDMIAELLHMGRTMFYKKVRSVTGYTPNDYIRIVRLRKAAELLREGNMNVSEVAYAVGFDNPYYFSKRFKEQFGVSPSQYK